MAPSSTVVFDWLARMPRVSQSSRSHTPEVPVQETVNQALRLPGQSCLPKIPSRVQAGDRMGEIFVR